MKALKPVLKKIIPLVLFTITLIILILSLYSKGQEEGKNAEDQKEPDWIEQNGQKLLPIYEDLFLDITDLELTSSRVSHYETISVFSSRITYVEPDICTLEVNISNTQGNTTGSGAENDSNMLIEAQFPETPSVLTVSHGRRASYEVVTGDSFEDGHEWVMPGASTEIEAAMQYKEQPIYITLYCEYEPYLVNIEDAQERYEENEETLLEVLDRFVEEPLSL
jgi:hypothetical protein